MQSFITFHSTVFFCPYSGTYGVENNVFQQKAERFYPLWLMMMNIKCLFHRKETLVWLLLHVHVFNRYPPSTISRASGSTAVDQPSLANATELSKGYLYSVVNV